MQTSTLPIRGMIIGMAVAAVLAMGMLFIYSDRTDAPFAGTTIGEGVPAPQ